MTALFYAHSGLRYLVLVAAVVVIVAALARLVTRGQPARGDRVLMSLFVGLVDLQVLLGLIMVFGGWYYPALMGHIVLMLLAAVTGHAAGILARRAEGSRSHWFRLGGVVVVLVLITAGIAAIGRGLFSSGAPSF